MAWIHRPHYRYWLPILQVALYVLLTRSGTETAAQSWGDPETPLQFRLAYAINIPAMILAFIIGNLPRLRPDMWFERIMIVFVAITWHWVGRFIDRRLFSPGDVGWPLSRLEALINVVGFGCVVMGCVAGAAHFWPIHPKNVEMFIAFAGWTLWGLVAARTQLKSFQRGSSGS
jgi:hypothetical protein